MEEVACQRINYELCAALDLMKLGIALDKMVEAAIISKVEARTFNIQASALLASLRTANYRHVGEGPVGPII